MQKKTLNLLQGHGFMLAQHACFVNDNDYAKFDDKLTVLLKTWELDNAMYLVCDLHHKRFLYTSPKLQHLLGNHLPLDWNPGNREGFYGAVHPDDLAFVLDTEIQVYEFLHPLPLYKKLNYRLTYEFRLVGADHQVYRMINHLILLEYDKYGNSWLLLIKSHLLPGMDHCATKRRSMMNRKANQLCLFNDENSSKSLQLLTKREQEILVLIDEGLSNKAIADKLFISLSTLASHKQNIIEKTRTTNIIKALSYANILGCVGN